MDMEVFKEFSQKCSQELPNEIDKILQNANGKKACAISFITTDDFYGFYIAWDFSTEIDEYYDWENGSHPDFLYQPLVDIVEADEEIDFCEPSDEKWNFAETLLSVLEKNIKEIPEKNLKRMVSEEKIFCFLLQWGMAIILKKCLKHL